MNALKSAGFLLFFVGAVLLYQVLEYFCKLWYGDERTGDFDY